MTLKSTKVNNTPDHYIQKILHNILNSPDDLLELKEHLDDELETNVKNSLNIFCINSIQSFAIGVIRAYILDKYTNKFINDQIHIFSEEHGITTDDYKEYAGESLSRFIMQYYLDNSHKIDFNSRINKKENIPLMSRSSSYGLGS